MEVVLQLENLQLDASLEFLGETLARQHCYHDKKKVQAQTLYNISHLSPRQHNHGSRAFRSNPRNKRKNTHVPPTSTQELYSGTELPSQFAKRVTCCSADINSRSSVEALQGIKHVLHQACVSHLDASFCFHIYLTQGALTFLGIISSRTPK